MHTTLKNTSGATRVFSFIPPHGRELADNAEVEIQGDLQSRIRTERARKAFEDAVASGEITIVNTPAVLIDDDSSPGTIKQVVVIGGSLALDDPRIASL